MFQTLQACRGAAALMVVLYHLSGNFAQARYFGWDGLGAAVGWGDAGVDFFFVLSGFLIASVHAGDIGRPERLPRYLVKRALRIYPTYWIVCAAVCAAALVVPALRYALPADGWTFLGALALVPLDADAVGGTGSPILFVAWSLQYELLFYAVMAAFIASRALGVVAVGAILVGHLHCRFDAGCAFPASFVGTNMIFLFAMGVAAAYVVKSRFRMPAPRLVAAAAALAFVGFGLYEVRVGQEVLGFDRRPVFGALATVLIVALVQAEARGLLALRQRAVTLLGDASYALYLLHMPIISVLCKAFARLHPEHPLALFAIFGFVAAVCVMASVLFYRWVEQPLLASFGRRMPGAAERRPAYAR